MIMAMLENGVMKGIIIGDVDTALVGQDASCHLPVREMGAEGKGNVPIH